MNNTIKPNAFKINFNENEFVVSFAETDDTENVMNEINLKFEPEQIMSVIAPLFASVVEYQEKFKKNLGLVKEDK